MPSRVTFKTTGNSIVVLIGLSNMPSRVTFKITGKFYSSSDRIK